MRTSPHVERLGRLLHNRIVRRVLHTHPTAAAVVAVGDLVDGQVQLLPVAVYASTGALVTDRHAPDWVDLTGDLAADLALLARVQPVELFAPYVLDVSQLDLRLDDPAGEYTD